MAKIMIVEDDRNLLSIYGDRLKAEGHEIITASDGEEALAVAVKEKPDLIISDVMMPKVSGFDMLDILRSTPETRNVKIIMMTALSQAEDRERATKLGADKYLVKTQVTLDDVARTVNEMVGVTTLAPAPVVDGGASTTIPVATSSDPADKVVDDLEIVAEPPKVVEPPKEEADTVDEEQAKISSQIDDFLSKNMPDTPTHESPAAPVVDAPTDSLAEVPQPVSVPDEPVVEDPTAFHPPVDVSAPSVTVEALDSNVTKPNIFELYEKELVKEAEQAGSAPTPTDTPKQ